MSAMLDASQASTTSALYTGFARAFRYPEGDEHVLDGAEYTRAFDRGVSDEAVSIHESAYVDADVSAVFEELVRFYEHFGLRRLQNAELPDHLSVELEFMHFMSELENHAIARGDDVAPLRLAQRDFLDRHVSKLLTGLRESLGQRDDKVVQLVDMCLEFVAGHRRALVELE